ncbi:MAG: gliding motility-associated C-terminal domain-containing protein, partial [Saprospiraceae bacterium]
ITICEGDSYVVGDSTYSVSGVYTNTLTTLAGCDSTTVLDLTVNPVFASNIVTEICEGDSYVVGDSTYTVSGIYTNVFTTLAGCDSTITLDLTVLPGALTVLDLTICEGEIVTIGSMTYDQTGMYSDTLAAANGCDSIINLVLEVLPIELTTLTATICEGEVFMVDNTTYTLAGNYTDTLEAVNGCDSIVNLNLFVNPVDTTFLVTSICEGDSFLVGNSVYTETGTYEDVLTSTMACDSFVFLTLEVVPSGLTILDLRICEGESYTVGNTTYTTSGIYSDTLISASGCDSIVNLTLTVNEVYATTVDVTICDNETYFVGGADQNTSGIYTNMYVSTAGCDSIVTTNLTVNPSYTMNVVVERCEGESYFVGGDDQFESGIYLDTLATVNSCDSIIVTELIIQPSLASTIDLFLCEGDSLFLAGEYQTESGIFSDTLSTVSGCDSIVVTNLTLINAIELYVEVTICEGDSIYLAGDFQTEGGEYVETYTSQISGCDSIVTTNLVVDPFTELFGEDQTICYGDEVELLVEGSENVTWFPVSGLSCIDCPNPVASPSTTTTYTITASSCMGTITETTITVFVNNPPSIVAIEDQSLVQGDSLLLSAEVYPTEVTITWSTSSRVICEDCNDVMVQPTNSTTYYVTAVDEFGCENQDLVNVRVSDECELADFEIPNIISPNGDGFNDVFELKYEGITDVSILRIYNRWGELVYETRDINQAWDGTFRGQALNPGVYIYYLEGHCLNNEVFSKTGNITLLK